MKEHMQQLYRTKTREFNIPVEMTNYIVPGIQGNSKQVEITNNIVTWHTNVCDPQIVFQVSTTSCVFSYQVLDIKSTILSSSTALVDSFRYVGMATVSTA